MKTPPDSSMPGPGDIIVPWYTVDDDEIPQGFEMCIHCGEHKPKQEMYDEENCLQCVDDGEL